MLVDGKAVAQAILDEVTEAVAALSFQPTLTAITCAPNFETQKYLQMKKKRAAAVGISLNVVELSKEVTTADVVSCVKEAAARSHGIVVQLPLPDHIEKDVVLRMVPAAKDPDGFSYGIAPEACVPPVVGAIDEISKRYTVDWTGKRVVILGEGRLVGQPARLYAKEHTSDVVTMNAESFDPLVLATADIIVTGIGTPRFITPAMVKQGVMVFDAGTSEDGGQLVGDVDPAVEAGAALLTPVPGGIGPITIAYLLKNLVRLAQ